MKQWVEQNHRLPKQHSTDAEERRYASMVRDGRAGKLKGVDEEFQEWFASLSLDIRATQKGVQIQTEFLIEWVRQNDRLPHGWQE